jgi:hypothetical protein
MCPEVVALGSRLVVTHSLCSPYLHRHDRSRIVSQNMILCLHQASSCHSGDVYYHERKTKLRRYDHAAES